MCRSLWVGAEPRPRGCLLVSGSRPRVSIPPRGRLPEVLAAHEGTIRILHTLRPLGVAMAGKDIVDPYKD